MNFKRGFCRIIFVLSLLASLASGIMCFGIVCETWDSEQVAYNDSKNEYEEIGYFWSVWDSDGWVDGKHKIVETLLSQHNIFPEVPPRRKSPLVVLRFQRPGSSVVQTAAPSGAG